MILKRNPNEIAYPDGKKSIISIIKYEGPANLIVWKHPYEDFNTGSSLHVSESEEALFYKDGIVEQVFPAGKYTLSTENYPFIGRLRSQISGGISSFNSKIYFIHKEHALELLWGTDSPIQVRDPVYSIYTKVMARGSYSIQVDNSKKFFMKFCGSSVRTLNVEEFNDKFVSVFSQTIKSEIARYIMDSDIEVLGICTKLDVLSEDIIPTLRTTLEEYGVKLVNFYIRALDIPENDPSRKVLEEAYAKKAELAVLGDSWGKVQARDILSNLANNPGAGGIASMGAGMGMGMAGGLAFANMSQQMFENMNSKQDSPAASTSTPDRYVRKSLESECPICHFVNLGNIKFCGGCGHIMEEPK